MLCALPSNFMKCTNYRVPSVPSLFALPELRSSLNALFAWPRKFMAYCSELKQFCCCFYRFLLNVRNILQFIEFIGVSLRDSMVVWGVVMGWFFFIKDLINFFFNILWSKRERSRNIFPTTKSPRPIKSQ